MSFPVVVGLEIGMEKLTYTVNQNGRKLGTRAIQADGRVYRWALNGATAIEAGKLVQTGVVMGASIHASGLTIVNATVTGVTTITITAATTPMAADYYADGDLVIDTSPGQAMYRIRGNTAAVSGANTQVTLYESDEIKNPLTSGTTLVGLRRNPYVSTIIQPTTRTGAPIGTTPINIPVSAYFWLQTWGLALVNMDQAPVAGARVVFSALSAGQLDISSTSSADTTGANEASSLPQIGVSQTGAAGADKYHRIFLTLSP